MFNHDFDFDPTCGYSRQELENLSPPNEEPVDFTEFWDDTRRQSESIEPDVEIREIWSPGADIEILEVKFNSWAGVRTGGWLVKPARISGGILFGHGYGVNIWPATDYAERGFACFYLCVRGFGLSAHKAIPWTSRRHVLYGIENRNEYVLRGATVDHWKGASALLSLCPESAGNLCYYGRSFGGGMGAMMLPWDDRFRAGFLGIPTFGHHPLRLKYKSTGSGEAVRLYTLENPNAKDVLKYYDAAYHAKLIDIPVLCAPALFDPAVIPPGQFAINNALGPQAETYVLPAGHFSYPGSGEIERGLDARVLEFFSEGG